MNKTSNTQATIRHLLTFVGGYLVARGYMDETDMVAAVGALATAIGTIWSIVKERKRKTEDERSAVPSIVLALLLPASFLLSSCATTNKQDLTQEMQTVAELAAYTGAAIRLQDHPGDFPDFVLSSQALKAMIRAEDYDPTRFADALRQLPINELSSERGQILIGAAVLLWDRYSARVVDLDKSDTIKPVMEAVIRGLDRALEPYLPPLPPTKPKDTQ